MALDCDLGSSFSDRIGIVPLEEGLGLTEDGLEED